MNRSVIYAYGFDGDHKEIEATVVALGMTAFTVVVLSCLHVGPDAELYLNKVPVERLARELQVELGELKTTFSHSKQVLVAVGPEPGDFQNIARDVRRAAGRIARFAEKIGADGIDINFGGPHDAAHAPLVAEIAKQYSELAPGSIVTAAPYQSPEFWGGKNGVLSRTATPKGNLFSWLNVQLYEGATNRRPEQYLDSFAAWANAIGAKGNGVKDPGRFMVPGCNATSPDFTPADFAAGVGNIRNKYPEIGGGFVWNLRGLNAPPKEWGKVVSQAVAH